jgi:hypothetical protein
MMATLQLQITAESDGVDLSVDVNLSLQASNARNVRVRRKKQRLLGKSPKTCEN